jgi:hypothetical protein
MKTLSGSVARKQHLLPHGIAPARRALRYRCRAAVAGVLQVARGVGMYGRGLGDQVGRGGGG